MFYIRCKVTSYVFEFVCIVVLVVSVVVIVVTAVAAAAAVVVVEEEEEVEVVVVVVVCCWNSKTKKLWIRFITFHVKCLNIHKLHRQ
jgi:hypothetical protein